MGEHNKLIFPEEFFKAEEREGFFISATMKSYWACCMEILNVINDVCMKYNLQYYADWGTLLGAARHEGFIPWDDDIDIAMLRPDYEKLLEVLPGELPEGYRVTCPYNNPKHKEFFAGVSNGTVIDLSKEHVANFYNCPFVATIDIFPIDYLPRNKKLAETVRSLFVVIWNATQKIKDGAKDREIEEAVKNVEKYLNVKIKRDGGMQGYLWKLANDLVKAYGDDDADELVQWCSYVNRRLKYDKHFYDETVLLPFETICLPAPADYEDVLTAMYGDWRIPVKGVFTHDYPAFKDQLEVLRKTVAEYKAKEQIQ